MTFAQAFGFTLCVAAGVYLGSELYQLGQWIRERIRRHQQRRQYPLFEKKLRASMEVELSKLPIGEEYEASNTTTRRWIEDQIKARLDAYRHGCGMSCILEAHE